MSLPVQETHQLSLDLQSVYLGDAQDAGGRPSTASDQPVSDLLAIDPIRFTDDGGGDHQQNHGVGIHEELEALPGYHRNVINRSSSVRS